MKTNYMQRRPHDDGQDLFPSLSWPRPVDQLFDSMMQRIGRPLMRMGLERDMDWPRVELNDTGASLTVHAELPGMKREDIEIVQEENSLVLRGECRDERTHQDSNYTERYYGRFERRIPLRMGVKWDQVHAQFNNGLLTITLPKEEVKSNVRRIAIEESSGASSSSAALPDKGQPHSSSKAE